eukprot:scaffold1910_cov251-Pinguiococcus_pyrenoidosus.AAC.2
MRHVPECWGDTSLRAQSGCPTKWFLASLRRRRASLIEPSSGAAPGSAFGSKSGRSHSLHPVGYGQDPLQG